MCMEENRIMLIRIKMTKGSTHVGKVDSKDFDEVQQAFKMKVGRFLLIDHSTGPILINVANIDTITRAQ